MQKPVDNTLKMVYHIIVQENRGQYPERGEKGEQMEQMTAKEILNLIDWLREQGFDNDKVVECIEYTEGKRKPEREKEKGAE